MVASGRGGGAVDSAEAGANGEDVAFEFGCGEEELMEKDKSNATGVDADRLGARLRLERAEVDVCCASPLQDDRCDSMSFLLRIVFPQTGQWKCPPSLQVKLHLQIFLSKSK